MKKNLLRTLVIGYFALLLTYILLGSELKFDEAVYIGISKYIYSLGQSGFYEYIRPPGLPLVIGLPLLLGLKNVFFARLLVVLMASANLFLVFKISRKLFGKKTAYISMLLLMASPIYYEYSTEVLPHIPAIFFMLLCFYFFTEEKYFLSGVFAACAFLFRFPYGLLLAAAGIALLSSKQKFNAKLLNGIKVSSGFALMVVPYLVYNLIYTANSSLGFFARILRPFFLATATVADSNPLYAEGVLFYFRNLFLQNPFLIFSILGIASAVLLNKKRKPAMNFLISGFILFSAYFTLLEHKELRYGLSFLAFMAIFAGYGIYRTARSIKMPEIKQKVMLSKVIALFFVAAIVIQSYFLVNAEFINEKQELWEVLGDSVVVSSSPFISLYADNLIEPMYYSPDELFKLYGRTKEADYLVLYPYIWSCGYNYCPKYDIDYYSLFLHYDVVFYGKIQNQDHIVLSRNKGEKVPEEVMQQLYEAYLDDVYLAKMTDNAKGSISFRIDSAGDAEKETSRLIKKKVFSSVNNIFAERQLPVVWAIIPRSYEKLVEKDQEFLRSLYQNNSMIEIAQNGYSFENNDVLGQSEFSGLSLEKQTELIQMGKDILEENFNTPKVFVPPYGTGDLNTLKALENLNYSVYSSNSWDVTCVSCDIESIPADIYFVKDWSIGELKDIEELKNEIDAALISKSMIVFEFQVNYLDEKDVVVLEQLLEYLESSNIAVLSISGISELKENEAVLDYDNLTGDISVPGSQGAIMLLFTRSGNYTTEGNTRITAQNIAFNDIEVCLNNDCKVIESKKQVLFEPYKD